MRTTRPNSHLANVKYEIRGDLALRAHEMEYLGYEIIPLNIGNPGAFGFRTPENMRLAMIENIRASEAYCHQKGIVQAREAIVTQQQMRGVRGTSIEDVFIGNGVSELIDMVLRALLCIDDEVLVPSPDYPLWTAAVNLNRGRAVHYPCLPENGFEPTAAQIEELITDRTRAIVVINPNNPTGAVYSRATLEAIARMAERHHLVLLCDEIYDQILYGDAQFVPMATLARDTLCATFSGLSKVYRACGYRVGWVSFSGEVDSAREYLNALDKLSALRLCSNVLGQWAVQAALSTCQSIHELTSPGGRLFQSRQAILDGVAKSKYLQVHAPMGALYAFIGVSKAALPHFDDQRFAEELLHYKHVLLVPGTSFNTTYKTHFRITNLPRAEVLTEVFRRIEELLGSYAEASKPVARPAPLLKLVPT